MQTYEFIDRLLDIVTRANQDLGSLRRENVDIHDKLHDVERKLESVEAKAEHEISLETVNNLMSALAEGRIIDAIRAHRILTGYGLKESKDAVEAAMQGWDKRPIQPL